MMKPVPRSLKAVGREAYSLGMARPGSKRDEALLTPRGKLIECIYDSWKAR